MATKKTAPKKEKPESVHQGLVRIQQTLKAPKGQTNDFGGYKYRSGEDILEAVKPILKKLSLTLSDTMVQLGDRYYIKATARLSDGGQEIQNSAYAREAMAKKGMDDAQITGSASSYARKYALNGLFAIDDASADPDSKDNSKYKPYTPKGSGTPADYGARATRKDPIMDATAKMPGAGGKMDIAKRGSIQQSNVKCDLCGAMGKFHKKGCPNG